MVINFFGKRGSGKTTTITGQLHNMRRPIVIIDVLGNFDDAEIYAAKRLTYRFTHSIPDAIEAYTEYVRTKKAPEVIVLRTGNPTMAADYLSACIWHANGGTLVLDEVDSIRMKEGSCFDEYIRYGRNHDGDLITGCRRPAELDRNITAAANKFYCFRTTEHRDIEYFEETVLGEKALMLQRLPDYHGIFINHDNKTIGEFNIDILGNIYHLNESKLES